MRIVILKGDITTASVDAIVNAANPIMLGGGGVDGAIHQAAGPALLELCRQVKPTNGIRCPVGEARITLAGKLDARYVIHTVGPRYHADKNPAALLKSSYENSLNLAVENNCESIAFPAISCGAYHYPLQEAAHISLHACTAKKYKDLDISFYLYSDRMKNIWQTTFASMVI